MLLKRALKGLKPSVSQRFLHTSKKYLDKRPFDESLVHEKENNGIYVEQMYESWQKDHHSVHSSWDTYFTNIENGDSVEKKTHEKEKDKQNFNVQSSESDLATSAAFEAAKDSWRVRELIQSYMNGGHEKADYDPLNLRENGAKSELKMPKIFDKWLDHKPFGFTEEDLDKQVLIDCGLFQGLLYKKKFWKVRDLINQLERIYCGKVALEFQHIRAREERNWVRERYEEFYDPKLCTQEHKLLIFERLCRNEMLSNFLKSRFSSSKRFGIEGCDSLISGLDALLNRAAKHKIERAVFGMPHRGRLNTLTNIFGKAESDMFAEFQELHAMLHADTWGNTDDVKYHLGTTCERTFENGHTMSLNIMANPAHLESVNPVVTGNTRASQDYMRDFSRDKVLAVQMHGDAGFAAQGVVYETMQMQDLIDYTVGGTIHIIINNQIGFTTTPQEARTGLYATEIGKAVDAPIIHVNADEPELVDHAFEFAVEYRQKFKKDIIIDLIGYRRYGHNELDNPSFTQPIMYQIIDQTKPVYKKYSEKLLKEGLISEKMVEEAERRHMSFYEEAYKKSKTTKFDRQQWLARAFEKIAKPTSHHGSIYDTGVATDTLRDIGNKICTLPSDLNPHPQIQKVYENRLKAIESGKGIDWATGEALAWATLLTDGYGVRLSGQDSKRGTFSHRHAVVVSQTKDRKYYPISAVLPKEEGFKYRVCNSHLSEFGVLNFEYGYSIANPNYLVQWEAQFGDFANSGQVALDNFIVAGETKWNVECGLVVLLPHGFDGQGPDHSSCRLQRLLAASDDDPYDLEAHRKYEKDPDLQLQETNVQVCNPSTSANYFHMLRRQLRRNYRKPLLVPSPKKLLKFRGANSILEEFEKGTRFHRVHPEAFPDEINSPEKINRLLFCSGQVYYEILAKRKEAKVKDTAIVRLEQLAPFPYESVKVELERYKNASNLVWVQEEHFNDGAWSFVSQRFETMLKELGRPTIKYVGRKPSASTAAGTTKMHQFELDNHVLRPLFSSTA